MKTSGLTMTDRLGIFYGTLIFFVMLPVTIFVSAIPTMVINNAITNKVISLTLSLGVISFGAFLTLLVAMVSGLGLSYGLSWLGKHLRVKEALQLARDHRPIEASRRVNSGALVGIALGLALFVTTGSSPIESITQRVEHLFPGPLVLSLGDFFSFNVSHTYAAATGFLSVGFLFAIAGIAFGSLAVAAVDSLVAARRQ